MEPAVMAPLSTVWRYACSAPGVHQCSTAFSTALRSFVETVLHPSFCLPSTPPSWLALVPAFPDSIERLAGRRGRPRARMALRKRTLDPLRLVARRLACCLSLVREPAAWPTTT